MNRRKFIRISLGTVGLAGTSYLLQRIPAASQIEELEEWPEEPLTIRGEIVEKWKITDEGDVVVEWKGVRLKGKITLLRSSDYSVKILEPYQDIEHGWHIPYFAMPDRNIWYADETRKLTEYGKARVAGTLVDIYVACRTVEENIVQIRQAIIESKADSKKDPYRNLMELSDLLYRKCHVGSFKVCEQLAEKYFIPI